MFLGFAVMFLIVTTTWGEDRVDFSHQEFTSMERCVAAGEQLKADWSKQKHITTMVTITYTCVGK
jgi:hypothetical protein